MSSYIKWCIYVYTYTLFIVIICINLCVHYNVISLKKIALGAAGSFPGCGNSAEMYVFVWYLCLKISVKAKWNFVVYVQSIKLDCVSRTSIPKILCS